MLSAVLGVILLVGIIARRSGRNLKFPIWNAPSFWALLMTVIPFIVLITNRGQFGLLDTTVLAIISVTLFHEFCHAIPLINKGIRWRLILLMGSAAMAAHPDDRDRISKSTVLWCLLLGPVGGFALGIVGAFLAALIGGSGDSAFAFVMAAFGSLANLIPMLRRSDGYLVLKQLRQSAIIDEMINE